MSNPILSFTADDLLREITPANDRVGKFVADYLPVAQRAAARLGVEPEVLLGQWGLETGWGQSVVPGTHNLGNIKDFSGGGVAAKDNQTGSTDKYRRYGSPEVFADDFAGLVARRFRGAAGAGGDAQRYFAGLQSSPTGAYAEDRDYVDKGVGAVRMARAAMGKPTTETRETPGAVDKNRYIDIGSKPARSRGAFEAVNDTVIEGANAVLGGVKATADFVSPGSALSRGAQALIDDGQAKQSDVVRDERARLQEDLDLAETAGEEVTTVLGYMARNPVLTAAQMAGMLAVPGAAIKGARGAAMLLGGGAKAAAAAGTAAGVGAGAMLGGGDAAGTAYELVTRSPDDVIAKSAEAQELAAQGLTMAQIKHELGTRAARAASTLPALLGAAGGAIGAERILAAGGKTAGGAKRVAATGAIEGTTEGAEEAATQFSGQRAAQPYNPEIDPTKGVAAAGAQGAVMGAGTGAAVAALSPELPAVPPEVAAKAAEPNSPLSKAATSGATAQQALQAALPPQTAVPTPEQQAQAQLQADQAAAANDVATVDAGLQAARERIRAGRLFDVLRAEGSPYSASKIASDLAIAGSKNTPIHTREQALGRIQGALQWAEDSVGRPGLGAAQELNLPVSETRESEASTAEPIPADMAAAAASVPDFQQTAVDKVRAQAARRDLGPQDADLVERFVRQPFGLTAAERVRAQALLNGDPSVAAGRTQNGNDRTQNGNGFGVAVEGQLSSEKPAQVSDNQNAESSTAKPVAESLAPGRSAEGDGGVAPTPAAVDRTSRRAHYDDLAELGFETIERNEDGSYTLRNTRTKQSVPVRTAADAQLARAAIKARVDRAAARANTDPTEAQKEAGNYRKGERIQLNGRTVIVENPAGSVRRGTAPDGTQWESPIVSHYGYFARTEGADGDPVDVVIGPRPDSPRIFVVDQRKEGASGFDEHKFVFGATSPEQARAVYLSNYPAGWNGIGALTELTRDQFDDWIKNGDKSKPVSKSFEAGKADNVADDRRADTAAGREQPAAVPAARAAEPTGRAAADGLQPGQAGGAGAQAARPAEAAERARPDAGRAVPDGRPVVDAGRGGRAGADEQAAPLVRASRASGDAEADSVTINIGDGALRVPLLPSAPDRRTRALERVAQALGRRLRFYRSRMDADRADGFVIDSDPSTIYLAADSQINPLQVLLHEFWHTLEDTNPEVADAVAQAFRGRVRGDQWLSFRHYYNDSKVSDEKLFEELRADLAGITMSEPTFWSELFDEIEREHGEKAPGLIAKMLGLLESLLDRMSAAFVSFRGEPGYETHQYVDDLASIREAYKKALKQYLKDSDTTQQAMGADILRAKKSASRRVAASPAREQNAAREEDAAGRLGRDAGEDRGREAADLPRYGTPVAGAVSAVGRHYSDAKRTTLSSAAFGRGLKGAERARLDGLPAGSPLRQRISFYIDLGNGVRPEAGVGAYAHEVRLDNLYDADSGKITGRDSNDFERKVVEAGYDGYMTRRFTTQQGAAVLLGKHNVPVKPIGQPPAAAAPREEPPQEIRYALSSREIDAIDVSKIPGATLRSGTLRFPAASRDAAAAEMERIGGDAKFSRERATKSDEFKRWSRGAELVHTDETDDYKGGKAVFVAYHGTTHDFSAFDTQAGERENFLGSGAYFTTEPEDASVNYAGVGPDLTNRIERRAEELSEDGDVTDELRAKAVAELKGPNDGVVMPVYVRLLAPMDLRPGKQWLERELVEDENGDIVDEKGPAVDALMALQRVVGEYGERAYDRVATDLLEGGDGFYASDLFNAIRKHAEGFEDDDGQLVGAGQLIQDVAREMGYDGLVMNAGDHFRGNKLPNGRRLGGMKGVYADTLHLMPFDASAVKSATGNSGAFSEREIDITKSAERQSAKHVQRAAELLEEIDPPRRSAVAIMRDEVDAPTFDNLFELSRYFTRRNRRGAEDMGDAAVKRRMLDALYADTLLALTDPKSGVGWYDEKVRAALDIMAEAHPEIATDEQARFGFIALVAITSNQTRVNENFEIADALYSQWKRTGEFPVDVSAVRATKAQTEMSRSLAKLRELIDEHGWRKVRDFMVTKQRPAAIEKFTGYKVTGENVDAEVYGATAFGSKLGAFFNNLYGNFDTVTMDRWWMRTVNRIRGSMLSLPNSFGTLVDKLDAQIAAGVDTLGVDAKAMRREIAAWKRLSDADQADVLVALEQMPTVVEYAKKRHKHFAKSSGPGRVSFGERTAENYLAKNLDLALRGDEQAPRNGGDRLLMRELVFKLQQRLKDAGIDMVIADIQAALWYYEKALVAKLRGKASSQEQLFEDEDDGIAEDYETAARRVLARRGEPGPAERRAGAARRDAGAAERAAAGADRQVALFSAERGDGRRRDAGRVDPAREGAPADGRAAPLQGYSVSRGVGSAWGPDPRIAALAERYARDNGIDYRRQAEYVTVDEERARRIADAYEAMAHAPRDARVKAAYADLIRQTRAQYDALVADGYEFTFFDAKSDPYAGNPWAAMRDLRDNRRMAVYGTYDGYGTDGITGAQVDDNPMLADTGLRWEDQSGAEHPVVANDLFRAVHDAFGHGLEGAGFRADGEENAWNAHVRLFTGDAVAAITTETRGQNSWLNYGEFGESNRTARVEDTVFAAQKTGLMPEWTWKEGRADDLPGARHGVHQDRPGSAFEPQDQNGHAARGESSGAAVSSAQRDGRPRGGEGVASPLRDSEGARRVVRGDGSAPGAVGGGGTTAQPQASRPSSDDPQGRDRVAAGDTDREDDAGDGDQPAGRSARPAREDAAPGGGRARSGEAAQRRGGERDQVEPGGVTKSAERAPLWYSQLARALAQAPAKFDGAAAPMWAQWLKANAAKLGVKADEITWSGIEDYLKLRGKDKLTREELAQWVGANGVRVEEVRLGSPEKLTLPDGWQVSSNPDEEAGGAAVTDADGQVVAVGSDVNEAMELALGSRDGGVGPTKYGTYVLPGGENYREVLLTLPERRPLTDAWRSAQELYGDEDPRTVAAKRAARAEAGVQSEGFVAERDHWEGRANIVAHIRVNDRRDADGKRVLFVEELQSDWSQQRRKNLKMAEESASQMVRDGADKQTPPAPFIERTEAWLALALKRVIKMAVDDGYERIVFITGSQSADRYDLSKQVNYIQWNPGFSEEASTMRQLVTLELSSGDELAMTIETPEGGAGRIVGGEFDGKLVEDVLGKEIAQKINQDDSGDLRGPDLKLGGEGMRVFYDQLVPQVVRDVLKKVGGGSMRDVALVIPKRDKGAVSGVDVMRWLGVPQDKMNAWWEEHAYERDELFERYRNRNLSDKPAMQPGFDITDKMREAASGGMPLFSRERAPRDVTQTPEFKRWFGDSKVVDAQGKPLVVYHGTDADFREFWPPTGENMRHPSAILGMFFSASHRVATEFSGADERVHPSLYSGANIMPVHLAIKNPIAITWGEFRQRFANPSTQYSEPGDVAYDRVFERAEAWRSELEARGIDGIRVRASKRTGDIEGTADNWIAFRPEQIKSAIGNDGGFDPTSSDITRSADRSKEDPERKRAREDGELDRFRQFAGDVRAKMAADREYGELLSRQHEWAHNVGDLLLSTKTGQVYKITGRTFSRVGKIKDNNWQPIYAYESGNPPPRGATPTEVEAWPHDYQRGTFAEKAVLASKTLKSLTTPRFSRERIESATEGWQTPSASKFDDLVYKMQDKHIDTKRVVDAVREAGSELRDDLDVYLQEELFHGRAAKRTEDFVHKELRPLVEAMRERGLSLAELDEYLHARHAKEANAVIRERNPEMEDGGSGMTDADADAYFAELTADKREHLAAAAEKVDAILKRTRKLLVEYQLESRDKVRGWGEMFEHYVPLMRDEEGAPHSGNGTGQGFSIKGKEVKSRTGSKRKVVDILANIAMQRERVIVRGEKNRVGQALVGLAVANPSADFWTVNDVPSEQVFNEKTGLVETRYDTQYKSNPNVVTAKFADDDGSVREHAVVFNERDERALRMASALKNLDASQLEGLLGVSAKATRYFASVNTQYNPVFGIVNLMRDVQGALVNLQSTELAGKQREIARGTLGAIRGIYADARKARKGEEGSSAWAALWEDFTKAGGQTGYRDIFATSADRAAAIEKALDPDAWADSKLGRIFTANGALKVPMAAAMRAARWLFDLLSDYNLAMENGVRLAAYKAGLDAGMSRERAASLAKNLTVNFNRKGQVAQQAGALYAFFNASMQGTARLAGTLFEQAEPGKFKTTRLTPLGKKVVAGGLLLGATQALALAAAGFGEDDPPEWARERNLIVPLGGKKYLSIPLPLGLHVLPNIGRVTTEWALSGFRDTPKRALSLATSFAEAFNPIGNAGMSIQTIAPTVIDPLVALTENRDWSGRPIYRESSNKATPGHALARDTATVWARLASEGINWASGGNKHVAGALSPTPDAIDYLIGQVTGGVGREISKVTQTATAAVQGETLPLYKVPLVGRLIGDAKSQASEGNAFYANLERLNKIETEIKGLRKDGDTAAANAIRLSNPEAYLITQANHAERAVQKLRREKRELVAADAPREQVKAIEERITARMASLNRAVEKLRERE